MNTSLLANQSLDIVPRPETGEDQNTIRRIHIEAFPSSAEAMLVDDLRIQARPTIGLVVEQDSRLLGHVLFSPVKLTGRPDLKVMGLAPVAVLPEYQRRGIGAILVRAGLEACREQGIAACVVLGAPAYYRRFGFEPAANFGLSCEFDTPAEAFMALELVDGALGGCQGKVRYHPAFDAL